MVIVMVMVDQVMVLIGACVGSGCGGDCYGKSTDRYEGFIGNDDGDLNRRVHDLLLQ